MDCGLFRTSLLKWYHKNKRDLPWRQTRDPYAIWVSEIMLQQTTVKTVIPYFERFLRRFSTLRAFAKASQNEYLKLWQGLGYYNRIRNFHKAARQIVKDRKGKIPATKKELMSLPGLGDYTASALASIAFGEPVSVVDGNVIRVLSRLFAYEKDIQTSEAKFFFRQKASELLDPKNPGDSNQALMELGATLCAPQKPACLSCPLQKGCAAYHEGHPEKYPIKTKKQIYRNEQFQLFITTHQGRVLLRKRLKDEILSGLWEFPMKQLISHPPPFQSDCPLRPVRHTIMNRRMVMYPCLIEAKKPNKTLKNEKWIKWNRLQDYPLTTVSRKILTALKVCSPY